MSAESGGLRGPSSGTPSAARIWLLSLTVMLLEFTPQLCAQESVPVHSRVTVTVSVCPFSSSWACVLPPLWGMNKAA